MEHGYRHISTFNIWNILYAKFILNIIMHKYKLYQIYMKCDLPRINIGNGRGELWYNIIDLVLNLLGASYGIIFVTCMDECICVCVCMFIGGGTGNPLQYSCLESPMDRGARRALDHRVAELDMTEWLSTDTGAHPRECPLGASFTHQRIMPH